MLNANNDMRSRDVKKLTKFVGNEKRAKYVHDESSWFEAVISRLPDDIKGGELSKDGR